MCIKCSRFSACLLLFLTSLVVIILSNSIRIPQIVGNIIEIRNASVLTVSGKTSFHENSIRKEVNYDESVVTSSLPCPEYSFIPHLRNSTERTPFTDLSLCIKNPLRTSQSPEFNIEQKYSLKYMRGSRIVAKSASKGLSVQDSSSSSSSFDVTIVSQTTIERIFFFPYLISRWNGPLSVTVQSKPSELEVTLDTFRSMDLPSRLMITHYTPTHVESDCVYRSHFNPRTARKGGKMYQGKVTCVKQPVYALNRLRNIAIESVTTSHLVVFDMDMWPALDLYESLVGLPKEYLEYNRTATIIPAFSVKDSLVPPCSDFMSCVQGVVPFLPLNRSDILHCLQNRTCSYFRPKSKTHDYFPRQWEYMSPSCPLTFVPCFQQKFMEPYVMVKLTDSLPRFDERFINYGLNKVEWIERLRYLGYEFHVLTNSFAVDIPHKRSSFGDSYMVRYQMRTNDMLALYRSVMIETRNSFADESRQLLCLPLDTDFLFHQEQ